MLYIGFSLVAIFISTVIVHQLTNKLLRIKLNIKPLFWCSIGALFISMVFLRFIGSIIDLAGTFGLLFLLAIIFAYFIDRYAVAPAVAASGEPATKTAANLNSAVTAAAEPGELLAAGWEAETRAEPASPAAMASAPQSVPAATLPDDQLPLLSPAEDLTDRLIAIPAEPAAESLSGQPPAESPGEPLTEEQPTAFAFAPPAAAAESSPDPTPELSAINLASEPLSEQPPAELPGERPPASPVEPAADRFVSQLPTASPSEPAREEQPSEPIAGPLNDQSAAELPTDLLPETLAGPTTELLVYQSPTELAAELPPAESPTEPAAEPPAAASELSPELTPERSVINPVPESLIDQLPVELAAALPTDSLPAEIPAELTAEPLVSELPAKPSREPLTEEQPTAFAFAPPAAAAESSPDPTPELSAINLATQPLSEQPPAKLPGEKPPVTPVEPAADQFVSQLPTVSTSEPAREEQPSEPIAGPLNDQSAAELATDSLPAALIEPTIELLVNQLPTELAAELPPTESPTEPAAEPSSELPPEKSAEPSNQQLPTEPAGKPNPEPEPEIPSATVPQPTDDNLDELLEFAFKQKQLNNYQVALSAFGKVLNLQKNSPVAPLLLIEISNIYKNQGLYDQAITYLSDGCQLLKTQNNLALQQELGEIIAYLRITKNTLTENQLASRPFAEIPPALLSKIDAEFNEWRNLS